MHYRKFALLLVLTIATAFVYVGCTDTYQSAPPAVPSTAHQVDTTVKTDENGLTNEQENITNRLQNDNEPGAIKHLYVLSAYSGQCIMYSTVKGKVTSSGKRLRPTTVTAGRDGNGFNYGYSFHTPNGNEWTSNELPQDDGTFGTSGEYLYWWDTSGKYHQLYLTGGFMVTLSNEPLPIKSITLNVEESH